MEENRDYEAEVAELMDFAPELEGGTLPDSVIEAAAEGKSLKEAYSDFRENKEEILRQNDVRSVTVVRMTVPCCGGLSRAAELAVAASGKNVPFKVVTLSTDGRIVG